MPSSTPLTELPNALPFWRRFLRFLLPLIGTNILQSLTMTINTIYVGQMLGVQSVAAVAVSMPVMFCVLAFMIGVSSGTTIIVGQAFGAKNKEKLNQAIGSTLFLSVAMGTLLGVVSCFYAREILTALGTAPDIVELALPYFYVLMAGCPITFLFIALTSAIRGVGDSLTPLTALFLTIGSGLLITPAFIQGWMGLPQLGIMAPAIATLVGQALSMVFMAYYLRVKNKYLQIDSALLKQVRFQPTMNALILRLGIPNGVQMITTSLAGLIIIRLINQFGSQATAAFGAITQIINYIQFPALSIGIATSIMAAQAIGADRSDALKKITRTAMLFNLIFTGSLIILAYLFSGHVIALFITDEEVIALGQSLLHISLWSMIFFGASAVLNAVMRASGTVWAPMLMILAMLLVVELPLAYVLSKWIGLSGIWYAYAATFVSTFFVVLAFYQFVWKRRTITKLV